ncbi:uncharacterized protein EV422DRAFT_143444 [Fimicolochytrium jonesii]|uniref:uncharacterized protein n=1 Tax=Fimicolochytrium jonesii TaxID=1396493 RepID=UPI0022FE3221|nr:uncharacterized protein EV422DRAFT_143444 [Fimicolochytrium jonesii]KAI8825843.1 hypothetical protein EV422DRAFT_143444 [Fimicolochytrium jonesii]
MLPTISSMEVVKIEEYLNLWYRSWNFDMFNFAELTNGHPLLYSGVHLLENNEALQCLQLNPQTFRHWLLLMESQYHSHPYHNAAHAADVLHAINQLLLDDQLKTQYTPIEAFALMLGAIGHDIDHPGYNNAFLVKSRHPWAILYCDTSVLELHHCAHLFTMTLGSQCDIFAEFCAEEYDEIRKLVIKLILATDMGKHFEYINKFKSRISTGTLTFGMELNPDNKVAVAEIAMKCSDLCNPTKIFPLSKKWTDAVMEEFYLQGDRERELGLPVSQFMDRNNTNVPKCQIGFIDFLVAPLFDSWNTFRNHDDKTTRLIVELGKNRGSWAALAAHHTPQSSVFGQSQSRFTASRQQLPSTPSIPNPPSMQGSGSINQADLPPQRSNILGLGSKRNSVVVDIPTGIPSMSRAGSQFASLARRMSSFELLTSRSEGIKDNGPLLIEPTDVKVGGDAV